VLARIETALFAAPGFKAVHAVSELATHPHVRFSGIRRSRCAWFRVRKRSM
jgi:hypothetical protein